MKPFYKPSPNHQKETCNHAKELSVLTSQEPFIADENKVYILEVQTSPNF
jgi:hypothetical protein